MDWVYEGLGGYGYGYMVYLSRYVSLLLICNPIEGNNPGAD